MSAVAGALHAPLISDRRRAVERVASQYRRTQLSPPNWAPSAQPVSRPAAPPPAADPSVKSHTICGAHAGHARAHTALSGSRRDGGRLDVVLGDLGEHVLALGDKVGRRRLDDVHLDACVALVRLLLGAQPHRERLKLGAVEDLLELGLVLILDALELMRRLAEQRGRLLVERGEPLRARGVARDEREHVAVRALMARPAARLAVAAVGLVAHDLLVALGARRVPHGRLLARVDAADERADGEVLALLVGVREGLRLLEHLRQVVEQ
mmetsp:Transcript_40353/g.111071  ORF Transcript_40353/g.111071 Transcript_40353/m.111071 type:complete len:267 (-) Transcript_40353:243-1043(-)